MKRKPASIVWALSFFAMISCTSESALHLVADDRTDPTSPTFEPSEIIRETFLSDAEPYCPPGEVNCCPTWLTDYGTDVSIETVVSFFEGLGFEGVAARLDDRFSPSPYGRLVRWTGSRGSGPVGWRKADVSTGVVAGQDDWQTVVELFAPACGETSGGSSAVSPAANV